jgi:fumarylacetoacetase
MFGLNETHDPGRRSWITTANAADADFPIQNLPYGVFSTGDLAPRCGVAIGDRILDLAAIEAAGLLRPDAAAVFDRPALNDFLALGPTAWHATRRRLSRLLCEDESALRDDAGLCARALVPMAGALLHLPVFVRSFTDFYASRHHAENVGTMFRGRDNALPPNWLHMPIGYNGRASTVVVSGQPIRRPQGQLKGAGDEVPRFGPSARLDIELELGAIVGQPSAMGQPVTTAEASAMIFGYVLLNDWSARDIQVWEYQPLGPFQSKAFATSISPWIVTAEALAPFRVAAPAPEKELLPYLRETGAGLFDIALEVSLAPAGRSPTAISRTGLPAHVLVGGAAARASCGRRLRHVRRRPARLRHDLRPDPGQLRLAARDHLERPRPSRGRRRRAPLRRGRRHGDALRLVRGPGAAHRLRALRDPGPALCPTAAGLTVRTSRRTRPPRRRTRARWSECRSGRARRSRARRRTGAPAPP